MSVNFPFWVYSPCFDLFARTVTYYPVVSQPGSPGFVARGIYDTNEIDVVAMDGSIFSDARTELDVFMPEWLTLPLQGDVVDIQPENDVDGGLFLVADALGHGNAGGELTLVLKRYESSGESNVSVFAPIYYVGPLDFGKPTLA